MSTYNMMGGGRSPMVPMLLQILIKAAPLDPPRLRDAFLTETSIDILTRTGGGNRDEYQAENDALTRHPLYICDRDDDFDDTFAVWSFRIPDNLKDELGVIYRLMYAKRDTSIKAATERVWSFRIPDNLKDELGVIYRLMYAKRDTSIKAATERGIANITPGKAWSPAPGYIADGITEAEKNELRKAAESLYEKVVR